MLILSLLYAVFLLQIGKSLLEEGMYVYRDPKFWVHVITISVITGMTTL
ncbi:MAG: hypothetical protein GY810_12470 [Aureispira sp.]|nr:hypothetical protein [Aureispira sp.]